MLSRASIVHACHVSFRSQDCKTMAVTTDTWYARSEERCAILIRIQRSASLRRYSPSLWAMPSLITSPGSGSQPGQTSWDYMSICGASAAHAPGTRFRRLRVSTRQSSRESTVGSNEILRLLCYPSAFFANKVYGNSTRAMSDISIISIE
jgi:hypothetical protein